MIFWRFYVKNAGTTHMTKTPKNIFAIYSLMRTNMFDYFRIETRVAGISDRTTENMKLLGGRIDEI